MSILYRITDDSLHVVPETMTPESVSLDKTTVVIMSTDWPDPKNPPIEIRLWSGKGMFSSTAKKLGRIMLTRQIEQAK